MLAHYSSDTFSTRIEYLSTDPYNTYTIYNPADVRSDVLNDIMSSYYLRYYRIFGLNGLRIAVLKGREVDDNEGTEEDEVVENLFDA
jgi:hypothetical protein